MSPVLANASMAGEVVMSFSSAAFRKDGKFGLCLPTSDLQESAENQVRSVPDAASHDEHHSRNTQRGSFEFPGEQSGGGNTGQYGDYFSEHGKQPFFILAAESKLTVRQSSGRSSNTAVSGGRIRYGCMLSFAVPEPFY